MDYKKVIGERIRAARDAKGWTLAELSKRTGDLLDLKRINAYEKGSRMPGPAEASILATALGRRAAFLMALEEDIEEHLIRNWRTLSERDRMSIYRKVETLALTSRDPAQDPIVHIPSHAPPRARVTKK